MSIRSTCKLTCLAKVPSSYSSKRGPLDLRIESALSLFRTRSTSVKSLDSAFHLSAAETQVENPTRSQSSSLAASSTSPSTAFSPPDRTNSQDVGLKVHLAGLNLPTLITKLLIQASINSSAAASTSFTRALTIPSLLQRQSQLQELHQALIKHGLTEQKLLAICNSVNAKSFGEARIFLIDIAGTFQPTQWPSFLILRLVRKIDGSSQEDLLEAMQMMLEVARDESAMETPIQADAILLLSRKVFCFRKPPSSFAFRDKAKEATTSSLITALTCMVLSTCLRILRIQPPLLHDSFPFHSSTLSPYLSIIQVTNEVQTSSRFSAKFGKRFDRFVEFLAEYLKILQPHADQDEKIKRSFESALRFSKYVKAPSNRPSAQVRSTTHRQDGDLFPTLETDQPSKDSPQSTAYAEIEGLLSKMRSSAPSSGRKSLVRREASQASQLTEALERRFGINNDPPESESRLSARSARAIVNDWHRDLEQGASDAVNLAGNTEASPLGLESSSRLLDVSLSALGFISADDIGNHRATSRLRYRSVASARPFRQPLNSIHSRSSLLSRSLERKELQVKLPSDILCLLMTLCNSRKLPEFSIKLFNFYILKVEEQPDDRVFVQLIQSLLKLDRSSDAILQVKLWCFEGVNLSRTAGQSSSASSSSSDPGYNLDKDQNARLFKLKPSTKLLNTLIHGLHCCGAPQTGFQIYHSFSSQFKVKANSITLSLLMKSSRMARASKSGGMGWGQRARPILHQPGSWPNRSKGKSGVAEDPPSPLVSSGTDTAASDPRSLPQFIPVFTETQLDNPSSAEVSSRLFKDKKNLRSFWSEDQIPAPILMKRMFENLLFNQYPELKDENSDCGKNPLELTQVRDGMSWWTRREMRAKDLENWMGDKWRGLIGGGNHRSDREASGSQAKSGKEDNMELGHSGDQEFIKPEENGVAHQKEFSELDHIRFDSKLFHEYLLLLEHLKSPMMEDYFSNLPSDSTASNSVSSLQSELPRSSYEDSILVLSWMKHLDVIPLRRSLNLCLLLLSENLPPISSFSSNKTIQNPVHGNQAFRQRPEGQNSAAGPLHGWLKDWLSEDEIPTEWEIGNYFKWGRKYWRRSEVERSRRRFGRALRRDGRRL